MKFSQIIEDSELSFHSPIAREEWDRITDVELERTEEITFQTPSGKSVPFRKVRHGEWEYHSNPDCGIDPEDAFCSMCGFHIDRTLVDNFDNYNFCPLCGADMRGETNG